LALIIAVLNGNDNGGDVKRRREEAKKSDKAGDFFLVPHDGVELQNKDNEKMRVFLLSMKQE